MESSDAVEDTFEATIVTATVIFVVVVVILTVLVGCHLHVVQERARASGRGGWEKRDDELNGESPGLVRVHCTSVLQCHRQRCANVG